MGKKLVDFIDNRVSRRSYNNDSLSNKQIEIFQKLIDQIREDTNLRIELVLNNGEAFEGFKKSYGMFKGVTNYFVLIGNKKDLNECELLGYYGEILVLQATAMNLGTCWVGGTFSKKNVPVELNKNETIIATIPVGNVSNLTLKEKVIYKSAHRKSKSIDQFMKSSDIEITPQILNGLKAVTKAPSAINRQPVKFSIEDNKIIAFIDKKMNVGYALDLGIAKLHFELGSELGVFQVGNYGRLNIRGDSNE